VLVSVHADSVRSTSESDVHEDSVRSTSERVSGSKLTRLLTVADELLRSETGPNLSLGATDDATDLKSFPDHDISWIWTQRWSQVFLDTLYPT
jgi:hypothetical protein